MPASFSRWPTTILVAAREEFLRTPGEQRLKCLQCGKALKVPASIVGKRLKCPQCGTSLAAATRSQACPGAVPAYPETLPPSLLETAAGPRSGAAPTARLEPARRR